MERIGRSRNVGAALSAAVVVALVGGVGALSAVGQGRPFAGPNLGFGTVKVGQVSAGMSTQIPLATTLGAQRASINAALNSGTVVFQPVTVNGVTILTADQAKTATVNAIASLPDATVLAYKVDSAGFVTGTDFALSGNCVGADGATTSSCNATVTFAPTAGGARTDSLAVNVTTTKGFNEITAALGAQVASLYGLPQSFVDVVLAVYGPFLHPLVDDTISGAINPVATVSGTGLPVISIAASTPVAEGNGGKHTVAVPVTLNAPTAGLVKFSFATADGTATAASGDYVKATGSGSIAAGKTSTTVPVTVNGDKIAEGDETFTVTITPTSGAAAGTVHGVVTLLNDDLPAVTVVGSTVPEGAPAYWSIQLAQPYYKDRVLHVALADVTTKASDHGAVNTTTVDVPAGSVGPYFVFATTNLDHRTEGAKDFKITVTGGAGSASATSTIKANST
jgi:hypothetical protein